jgi:hypothetical protein
MNVLCSYCNAQDEAFPFTKLLDNRHPDNLPRTSIEGDHSLFE